MYYGVDPRRAASYAPQAAYAPQGIFDSLSPLGEPLGEAIGNYFGNQQLGRQIGGIAGQVAKLIPYEAGPPAPAYAPMAAGYNTPQGAAYAPQGFLTGLISQALPLTGLPPEVS